MGVMNGSKSARKLNCFWLGESQLMNRIREARLLAEFREQDSYINSDYDSDSDLDSTKQGETSKNGQSPPSLTNSLITQATSLVKAARAFKRPTSLPQPGIRFVLNRMEDRTYSEPRINETFRIIREMGVDLVLGKQSRPEVVEHVYKEPVPARNILLDLSVLVALCCDSAHHPLPTNEYELEARFRAISPSSTTDEPELLPHINVTRDLRDQLNWELQHSLIDELHTRISSAEGEVQFWVTEEVKGRLPNIIDTIGGPREKSRAKALFGEWGGDKEEGLDFWANSRWKGIVPALGDMRLRILPGHQELDLSTLNLDPKDELPSFNRRLVQACDNLLAPPSGTITPPAPLHRQKYRRSRHHKAQEPSASTRLPSQHTLNSFSAGASRGWTVLTNNRGAVGKVMRDMGVKDGLPFDDVVDQKVVIWVVNPSSLSEWRRLEVEESNRALIDERSSA
jgi:hypothetical protein